MLKKYGIITLLWVAILVLGVVQYVPVTAKAVGTQSISGFVVNQNNVPVPDQSTFKGVSVQLYSASSSSIIASNITSLGGYFSFNVQPGYYQVMVPPQIVMQPTGNVFYAEQNASPAAVYVGMNSNVTLNFVVNGTPVNSYVHGTIYIPNAPAISTIPIMLYDKANNYVLNGNAIYNGTKNAWLYNISAYNGQFVLEVNYPGYSQFNSTNIVINVPANKGVYYNATILPTFIQGYIKNTADGTINVNDINVTIYNSTYGFVYHSFIAGPSPYYTISAFPGNFTMFLSANGYMTNVSNVVVSNKGTTQNIELVPLTHEAQFIVNTTFGNFKNSSRNNVSISEYSYYTNAYSFTSLNYSFIHYLPAQIALAFSGGKSIVLNNKTNSSFENWIKSNGPIYYPPQNMLNINQSYFANATKNVNLTITMSKNGISVSMPSTVFISTSSIPKSRIYNISTSFRYPHSTSLYQYNFYTTPGFVLTQYNTPDATVSPINGTWVNFSMVPKKESQPTGFAVFTVKQIKNITAIVNITAPFFGIQNIINSTAKNYTVIVKTDENVTFSAQNSLVPVGNITKYIWNFGNNKTSVVTTYKTNYTYSIAGIYNGSLTIVGSGNETNTTSFKVWVAGTKPFITYHANVTKESNPKILFVKSFQSVTFNATGTYSMITNKTKGIILNYTWAFGNKTISSTTPGNISFTFIPYGSYKNYTNISGKIYNFHGWLYNASLRVYDVAGNLNITNFTVVVNDTQKPVPVINITNSKGIGITSAVEGSTEYFNASHSYEANGGIITKYLWNITYSNKTVFYKTTSVKFSKVLPAAVQPYKVTLNVTTLAGKSANTTVTFVVTINTTIRPIIQISNLTAPSLQVGNPATLSVIITNVGGVNSTADNVSVIFNISNSIINTPSQVKFYTTSGSFLGQGKINLKYNETVKAEVTWTPSKAGTFNLGVNVTASNEWPTDYQSTKNTMLITVTVSQSWLYQNIVYIAVGIVIIVVIVVIYFLYRRKMGGSKVPTKKSNLKEWKPEPKIKDNKTDKDIKKKQ